MRTKRHSLGQSTMELALLLPILAGLLLAIATGFRKLNQDSDDSLKEQSEFLLAFNHGNSGAIQINGEDAAPGRLMENIPGDAFNPLDLIPVDRLLSGLLDKMFAWDKYFATGAIKGYAASIGSDYVHSGFRPGEVDLLGVKAWAAAASGGLRSDQATGWLRGDKIVRFEGKEFLGAGIQGAGIAYAEDQFKNPNALLGGALGGAMSSTTSTNWINNGKNEILKGAAIGAINGAANGIRNHHLDLGDMARQSLMGAFNTNSVAKHIPLHGIDARASASFGAANAAFAALISEAKPKDILRSALTGAFGSRQSQSAIAGQGGSVSRWSRTVGAGSAMAGGQTAMAGGNLEAVGRSAAYAAGGQAVSTGVTFVGSEMQQVFDGVEHSVRSVIDRLTPDKVERVAKKTKGQIDQLKVTP